MPYVGKSPADIIATAVDTTTGTFSGDLTVDTSTLVVDSANNRVGLGTVSPDVPLEISVEGSSITNVLKLTTTGSGTVPALQFEGDASGTQHIVGRIRGQQDDANDGGLVFETESSGTVAERMRINSSGNLLVGKTSATIASQGHELRSASDGGWAGFTNNGERVAFFNRLTSDGEIAVFRKNNVDVGSIGYESSGFHINGEANHSGLSFQAPNVTPRYNGSLTDDFVHLGSTSNRFKNLYLSGGVYLGGTGSANYLQDYEEGTASLSTGTGSVTIIYATYTKIGRLVTVRCGMYNFTDRTTAQPIQINGLPFTSSSTNQSASGVLHRYFNGGGDQVVTYIGTSSNRISLYQNTANGNYQEVNHNHLSSTSSAVYLTVSYETA